MKGKDETIEDIRNKFNQIQPFLNERAIRIWCATEAKALGRGGKAMVCNATGISWPTVAKGMKELAAEPVQVTPGRIRRPGGGRKKITKKDTTLLQDLEALIDPSTREDPEIALRWSSKSTIKLA